MTTYDPIAYTYDADYHCPACAFDRFGRDDHGFVPETATDTYGELIGAVAPWDEWQDIDDGPQVLACGTCHEIIDEWEVAR